MRDSGEHEQYSATVQFFVPASSDSIAFGMISPISFSRFEEYLAISVHHVKTLV